MWLHKHMINVRSNSRGRCFTVTVQLFLLFLFNYFYVLLYQGLALHPVWLHKHGRCDQMGADENSRAIETDAAAQVLEQRPAVFRVELATVGSPSPLDFKVFTRV
jgi:hypothetical protein